MKIKKPKLKLTGIEAEEVEFTPITLIIFLAFVALVGISCFLV